MPDVFELKRGTIRCRSNLLAINFPTAHTSVIRQRHMYCDDHEEFDGHRSSEFLETRSHIRSKAILSEQRVNRLPTIAIDEKLKPPARSSAPHALLLGSFPSLRTDNSQWLSCPPVMSAPSIDPGYLGLASKAVTNLQ